MTEHKTEHRVVVVGGGYAGTVAANRLCKRGDVRITMVNPRPAFVDRVRLHQLVAGTGEATIDYGTLLGAGIELVVDSATRIDTAARTVRLASGRALEYDHVVYAVGSTEATPSVLGGGEFACRMGEFESAHRLRARLDELPADAPVTVVGGGPTGIETAAELAERGWGVTLVCGGTLMPSLSASGRRYVRRWLSRHGVTMLESDPVLDVLQDSYLRWAEVDLAMVRGWPRTIAFIADSGGKAVAARRPVPGAARAARYLIDLFRKAGAAPDLRIETVNCNSTPAMAVYSGDRLEGVYLIEVENEVITTFYAVRNPEKLTAATVPRRIGR